MLGLDPQDCAELVKLLKSSARQLEQTSLALNQTVARTQWQGQDSHQFRATWPAHRQSLRHTAKALEDTASVVLRNITEQEHASAVEGNGGGLLDNMFAGAKGLWDDVTDSVDGGLGAVKDGLGWAGHLIQGNLSQAGGTLATNLAHLGSMAGDMLTGNPPSMAGLGAQLFLTAGSASSFLIAAQTGGLVNLHLFDDGSPKVGDPVAVTKGSARRVQLPTSAAAIFGSVEDAYAMGHEPGTSDGDIRIVKVEQPVGTASYIVTIPGTEQWVPNGSGQARDLTSNLMLVAGQSTTAQRDVVLAMEKAGIPPGAPVMLAGHSQGGMLAGQLGSDAGFLAKFNVTNIMTVGSPIDVNAIDPGIKVLAAQHDGDLVPKLDLGGVDTGLHMPSPPPNVSVVSMDDPPRDVLGNVLHYAPSPLGNVVQDVRDIGNNHATEIYKADLANTDKYPGVASYENDPSMVAFLSNDPSKVSAVDINVGRK